MVILCFFLPFFPQGCDSKQKKEDSDKARKDSINFFDSIANTDNVNVDKKIMDSILKSDSASANKAANKMTIDTINNNSSQAKKENKSGNDNSGPTDKLIKKFNFLKIFIRPGDNYSGIGYLIDASQVFVGYCGIFVSFILLITGLFFKYFKFSKKYLFNGIFHVISIVFLLSTCGGMMTCEKLWGYWVCIVLWGLLCISDWFFAFTVKQE